MLKEGGVGREAGQARVKGLPRSKVRGKKLCGESQELPMEPDALGPAAAEKPGGESGLGMG